MVSSAGTVGSMGTIGRWGIALALACLLGCATGQSRATAAAEKIEIGMSQKQVEEKIGAPDWRDRVEDSEVWWYAYGGGCGYYAAAMLTSNPGSIAAAAGHGRVGVIFSNEKAIGVKVVR
ncbi:MAG: hypothetical protein HY716_04055 [Planctomycetes bacterium]|nr:hypothetical protein [Planctomycetota bacterium]